jgi:UDP-glucose 4-epimerase
MNKVLILGGTGYIGSSLFEHLHQLSYKITTVDLEWFGNYVNSYNINADYNDLDRCFIKDFDVVILLAGHSSVQMCEGNPLATLNNNVRNFVNLLNKLEPRQKFIYASSSSVYGNIGGTNVDEECLTYKANNFYDLSKSEIDNYAKLFPEVRSYGLRFGTVNGRSHNFRKELMINAMSFGARCGELQVFNPKIHRPILGINDLCRAIEVIIKRNEEPGIYNLASFNSTVLEIAKEVRKVFPCEINIKPIDSKSKPYDFSINCHKFESVFDFQFQDTVASIAESCSDHTATYSDRSIKIPYV